MASILNEVKISVPVSKVSEALTRQTGYRGWWNAAAQVPEKVGGEAKLHFVKEGNPVNMSFRIDAAGPNEIRWTCTAHDMPSWVGTALIWNLRAAGGDTLVSFEHAGWKDAPPEPVRQGWQHFLGSLKAYLETGTGQPW